MAIEDIAGGMEFRNALLLFFLTTVLVVPLPKYQLFTFFNVNSPFLRNNQ